MASQLVSVTNNRKLRRNQTAELNARRQLLPEIMANQRRSEDLERAEELKNLQIGQFNRQHALNRSRFDEDRSQFKKTQKAQNRANQIGMGLAAGKMGLNIASTHSGKTVGGLFSGIKDFFTPGKTSGGTPATTATGGKSGFFDKISLGTGIGSGLIGFGASQMFGGKSKAKKVGVGMAAGGLAGTLTGSSGNSFNDTLTGMVSGGFGGLF